MGNKLPEHDGYPQGITGKLVRAHNSRTDEPDYFWQGGDTIGVVKTLIEDKRSGIKRFGDKLFVGKFKLELTAYYPQVKIYLAKRLA